ncbi:NusG domain II-containing protein [Spirochaeta cellobiosiphila]|uniref:NusG domain II-containing protein n=1 Tax=Spirochaeta cellobiosiphila TaxID=504483 RepID=UPI001469BF9C|nr:NusG domain II-containing protein [Spirochaeta cellobiosiphila]
MRLKLLDYIISLVALSLSLYLIVTGMQRMDSLKLVITQGDNTWVYALDKDYDGYVAGPLGDTHFVIKNGYVDVLDSPCLNKLCVTTPPIHKNNQWIACLPNGLLFRVVGEESKEAPIDVNSY